MNEKQKASTSGVSTAETTAMTTTSTTKPTNHAVDATTTTTTTSSDGVMPPEIRLGTYWDEWARCIGSGYQADHLYRVGRFDSCARQWKDMKTATKARMIAWRDPKGANDLVNSTYYKKRTTISPTAGAIWELKENPSWH